MSQRSRYFTCTRKVKYSCSESAQRAIREVTAKHSDTLLSEYNCSFCGGIHIGNDLSKKDAAKSLKKMARGMNHPNFWIKAPLAVQQHMVEAREKLSRRVGNPSIREICPSPTSIR